MFVFKIGFIKDSGKRILKSSLRMSLMSAGQSFKEMRDVKLSELFEILAFKFKCYPMVF